MKLGAGRGAKTANLYCEVNESAKPYGVATHRHTPEIEEQLVGTEYRGDAIARVLSSVDLNEYINGMTAEELTELIMQTNA